MPTDLTMTTAYHCRGESQCASTIIMVRPTSFGFNAETAASNRFADSVGEGKEPVAAMARTEFDSWVEVLRAAGVRVLVLEDTPEPCKPDAIFSNNWISFHQDGTAVLYPMEAPSRRAERRKADIERLLCTAGLQVKRWIDLSTHEDDGRFMEGTGSLILDRVNRVAFACRSSRTDPLVAREFGRRLGYDVMLFGARDPTGCEIYHTNVMLSLGERFALICEAAVDSADRDALLGALVASGRAIVSLSWRQVMAFAANALELRTLSGRSVVAMSSTAFASLREDQRAMLADGNIVHAPLPTIERLGGGSARCTITECPLESL